MNEVSWIRCSDRLPDRNGDYLVVLKYPGFSKVSVLSFSRNLHMTDELSFETERRPGWYEYDSEVGNYELTNISYWAKLPALPDNQKGEHR